MGLKQNITTDCKEIYLSGGFIDALIEDINSGTATKIDFEATVGCTGGDPFEFTILTDYIHSIELDDNIQSGTGGDTLINLVINTGTSTPLTASLDLFDPADHATIIAEIIAADANISNVTIDVNPLPSPLLGDRFTITVSSNISFGTLEINGDRQFGAGPLVPEVNPFTADGISNCYIEVVEDDATYLKFTSRSFDLTACDVDTVVLADNIYTIKATITYSDNSTDSRVECVFADCTVKCQIAEKMASDPGSGKFDDLLICYDGVRYNAECCRCCTAYDLLVDLQDKVGNLGKCPC